MLLLNAKQLGWVVMVALSLLAPTALAADSEDCAEGELSICDGSNDCGPAKDWVKRCGDDECYCRSRPASLKPSVEKPPASSDEKVPTENLSTTALVGGVIMGLGGLAPGLLGVMVLALGTSDEATLVGGALLGIGVGLIAGGAGLADVGAKQVPVQVSVGPGTVGLTVRF